MMNQPDVSPPEEFVAQVKDVLENLYDFPFLQEHPLAQPGGRALAPYQDGSVAQRLRQELLAAMEVLNPGDDLRFRAPQARLYHVLHLRYVEGLTMQEVAEELAISGRQAYRDLRKGVEGVAAVLWSHRQSAEQETLRADHVSSVTAEIERLESHLQPVDLRQLVAYAQQASAQLAERHQVAVQIELPDTPLTVAIDAVIGRQVLVNLFSHAIRHAADETVTLDVVRREEDIWLTFRYQEEEVYQIDSPLLAQLLARLGWQLRQGEGTTGALRLQMAMYEAAVLVIDDNEELIEMLTRFLAGYACRVIGASGGRAGLELAAELTPDAVILDVMMADMDGWEVLQRLRHGGLPAETPVIICSVFNDPELAYSLGATLVVAKPVRRRDVLAALRRVGVIGKR